MLWHSMRDKTNEIEVHPIPQAGGGGKQFEKLPDILKILIRQEGRKADLPWVCSI
jgi:hypothetical protein